MSRALGVEAGRGFRVTRGGRAIFQTAHDGGVAPVMLAALAHGKDLRHCEISCVRIGEAAARLLSSRELASIDADTLSAEAQKHLRESGIKVSYRQVLAATDYTPDPGELLVDKYSRTFDDSERLFEDLRLKLLNVVDHQIRPSDLELMAGHPTRHGAGGGGT